jgi:hypothetical protein
LSILDLTISCKIFIRHELAMQIIHRPYLRDDHDGKSQKTKYATLILCSYYICYNYQPEIVNIQTAVHCHFSKPLIYISNSMLSKLLATLLAEIY